MARSCSRGLPPTSRAEDVSSVTWASRSANNALARSASFAVGTPKVSVVPTAEPTATPPPSPKVDGLEPTFRHLDDPEVPWQPVKAQRNADGSVARVREERLAFSPDPQYLTIYARYDPGMVVRRHGHSRPTSSWCSKVRCGSRRGRARLGGGLARRGELPRLGPAARRPLGPHLVLVLGGRCLRGGRLSPLALPARFSLAAATFARSASTRSMTSPPPLLGATAVISRPAALRRQLPRPRPCTCR